MDFDLVLPPALPGAEELVLSLPSALGDPLDDTAIPQQNLSTTTFLSPQKRQRLVSTLNARRVRPRKGDVNVIAHAVDCAEAQAPLPFPEDLNPVAESEVADDGYAEFADCVLEGAAGFFQISRTLFVVQGWDKRTRRGTVRSTQNCSIHSLTSDIQDSWYHAQQIEAGEVIVVCLCPQKQCMHERFLMDRGIDAFGSDRLAADGTHNSST